MTAGIPDPPRVAEGAPFLVLCHDEMAEVIALRPDQVERLRRDVGPVAWEERDPEGIDHMLTTVAKIMKRRARIAQANAWASAATPRCSP